MKKIVFASLLICLCIVVSACTATDPNNLFGTVTQDLNKTEDILYYTGAYQYGNMQTGSVNRFMLINNEVVFDHYKISDFGSYVFDKIFCYDLITGKVRPYCKDATCTHEKCESCPLWSSLEVYDGKLFGKNKAGMQVTAIEENSADIIVNSEVNDFFHHDDKLYVKTMDSSLVVFENKKESKMILEEYTGNDAVIFDNYLYAKRSDKDFIRVDLTVDAPKEEIIIENGYCKTDGQHIYYVDLKNYQLYRCDMDGTNTVLLVEQPVFYVSFNFDDAYVYYRLYTDLQDTGHPDSRDIYRFPKEDPTQVEKIATLPLSIGRIFTVPGTDKIFVCTYTEGVAERPYYIMGTDGSNPTKLEIPKY